MSIVHLLLKLSDRPDLIALCVLGVRLVYVMVSRIARPYPRMRAAVEAVSALGPDCLRFLQKAVEAASGKPVPSLDVRPSDPEKEELRRRLDDAERQLESLRGGQK